MNTILFVDDDVIRMSSYVDFLKQSGYNIVLETNSSNVLTTFKEKKEEIDLIILDMMMPIEERLKDETSYGRRTGLYLLKQIREISANVPIMIFTVVRDHSLREETAKYGASPYLEKPIMPSRLEEEIKKKLEETKRERK